MSNNHPLVRYYFDSESLQLPSCQNSDDLIHQYFYDFGEVQIEQWHIEPNQQIGFTHNCQNSQKRPQSTIALQKDSFKKIQNHLSLEKNSSDLEPPIVNSEQIGIQFFQEFNSKISTELGKSYKMPTQPPIQKKKTIKKLSKKAQQPKSPQRKSCRIEDSSFKTRTNFSSSIRKGKHSQSKTQKFIKFMTRFYFNKNFNQYFNKKLRDRKTPLDVFDGYSVPEKIKIINQVIQDLESYQMRIHYSVRDGTFFMRFSDEVKSNIQDLFWKVVRKAYQIKLETSIRRILQEEENSKKNDNGFLDRKGQEEFEKAFQQIFHVQPYYQKLVDCDFQSRMWEYLNLSKINQR